MQKTIFGGERLGAGHKMKIELHPYERSTHDLGYVWRSSMAVGTLVPFIVEPCLPGDTFDIELNADVKTHPTLGPLFGSFKLQLDIFEAPQRLYNSALMQNTTQLGNNIASVLLPQIQSDAIASIVTTNGMDLDNLQINPSALLSYLGIRGWGINNTGSGSPTRALNATPLLAYWEIYKNYYSNKQELIGFQIIPQSATAQTVTSVVANPGAVTIPYNTQTLPGILLSGSAPLTITINFTGAAPALSQIAFYTSQGLLLTTQLTPQWTGGSGTWTSGQISLPNTWLFGWTYVPVNSAVVLGNFNLTAIDNMKNTILQTAPTARLTLTSGSTVVPYSACIALANTPSSQCGLGIKTYQSDLLNNWVQTTWYNAIQAATAVSTAGGAFNIDALILARKVYDLLNRIAVSGGTYQDYIDAAYDHHAYSICQTPIYHGGLSKEVIFQEVVSTAQSAPQPLGTLAGKGHMAAKHKGGRIRIKTNEHGYIMGIVSLTPRLDYSQGNLWHTYALQTMNDFHKPALDQIGWQSLITEQMAYWDTHWNGTTWVQNSAGFQPAWVNYMTNVNRTYGNFAARNNEMFMTLNRRYSADGTGHIIDQSTYIDPSHYNFIFAQTSLDSQNFWTQIMVNMQARRKMSAKIMPNL